MKRLKKLFACFLVVLMVVTTSAVSVSAASIVNTKVLDGISFSLATPGGGTYSDTRYWDKVIDGRKAYCVQPGIMELADEYIGSEITEDWAIRTSLADYWGRHMQGNSAVQQFYVQVYCWEMLGCTLTGMSDPSGQGRVSYENYQAWCAGIQPAIDAYYATPSFANETVTVVVGTTETRTDSNNAFSYYTLKNNASDAKVESSGNTLKLSAASSARKDGAVSFKYNIDTYYESPGYYWRTNSNDEQDCMTVGGVGKEFSINVKIDWSGKCKIVKSAEDGKAAGLKFRITGPKSYDKTVTIGADGTTLVEKLEPGTYTVTEVSTPDRYVQPASQTVKIEAGKTATVNFNNVIKKFRVTLIKTDAETTAAQGAASLAGAKYGLYTDGVLYKEYVTDAQGKFTTEYLACGKGWMIKEIAPSPGYQLDPTEHHLAEAYPENYTVELNSFDKGVTENVIRGGVRVEKWDAELDARTPQGDGTLANAVFEIYNRNAAPVKVNGAVHQPGAVMHTMNTDANGVAQTDQYLLPYGTYEVIEKTPPAGYLATGTLKRTFTITEHGVIIDLSSTGTAIKNNPIRGGVRVEKWDNEIDAHSPQGAATFEGAVFDLYNRSTYAVLVNGTLFAPGAKVHTMTTDADGVAHTAANLLPYGTYEVIESAPPKGYLPTGVLNRVFSIRQDGVIVNLNESGTAIKNNPIRGDLEGVKISENMGRMSHVPFKITSATTGESHIIVTDENGYFNTASSWNPHSQNTNEGKTEFDGVWFGDIDTLDDSLGALLYDTYIIEEMPCLANFFHELTPPFEVKISRHNTLVKLGTITNFYDTPPEIGTTATDQDSETHIAAVDKTTTIVDVVSYTGLKAGQEYTLEGVLMDKATGKELLIDGKPVTASTKFEAEDTNGTVEVKFMFNSLGLAGKSVVVFETLFLGDTELAVHSDIEDEGQTVTFTTPEIGTTAIDESSGNHTGNVSKETTIIDKVTYSGLKIGNEYTVKGILMDKETGEPLLVNGEKVTTEATFTAETEEGEIELAFTFSSIGLQGKVVVVFETLYFEDLELAVHADLTDFNQSVGFEVPRIGTTAKDSVTLSGHAYAEKSVTIIDTVQYSGVQVDNEYTISGVLMDKTTGQPLLVGGKQVMAETTFTPKTTEGTVDVKFTFNASGLAGKSIVVFEKLLVDGEEIAAHEDIQDSGQTITFANPRIKTSAKDQATGTRKAEPGVQTTIVDTVTYKGLIPGHTYTVNGVLMDKSTGKALLVNGAQVTATKTFTAQTADGTVELKFTFNSSALYGKEVVVFESLTYNNKEIATHTDLSDENQTVTFNEQPKPPVHPPKTGDSYDIIFWAVISGIGVLGMGTLFILALRNGKRKKRVNADVGEAEEPTEDA